MLTTPMDVLYRFPVRKSKRQKQAFRDEVQSYVTSLGYPCKTEKGSFGGRNLVIGDPNQARYLITAHYDTCAWMPVANRLIPDRPFSYVMHQLWIACTLVILPVLLGFLAADGVIIGYLLSHDGAQLAEAGAQGALVFAAVFLPLFLLSYLMTYIGPENKNNANNNTSGVVTLLEIARSLPRNQRHKVCFVLFDLNEAGLLGSSAYRKAHKQATDHQIIVDLSCVGDGDDILLIPTRQLKEDVPKLRRLYKCCGYFGQKSVLVQEKDLSLYPSDHRNFPYAVSVSAFHKGKKGHYTDRIHTTKDTVLEITNVNILRAAIISMVAAAQ